MKKNLRLKTKIFEAYQEKVCPTISILQVFGLISPFRQRGSSTNFPRTNFFLFQTLFFNPQGVDLWELEVSGWIVGLCLLPCALILDFLSIWYFPIVLKRSWHLGSVLLKSFLLHYSIWNDLLTGIIHKIIFNHKNNSSHIK